MLISCADEILKTLSILPFLLPDARSKVDPEKLIYFAPVSLYKVHSIFEIVISLLVWILQDCTDITAVAEGNPTITPYIMVIGQISVANQAFLVVDKTLISELPLDCSLPFALLAAFLSFSDDSVFPIASTCSLYLTLPTKYDQWQG